MVNTEAAIASLEKAANAAGESGEPLLLSGKVTSPQALETALLRTESKLGTCTAVDLSNNGLSAVPSAIYRLRELTSINLRSNKISELQQICLWNKLTSLDLSNNCLIAIDPLLLLQTKLIDLNVTNNDLTKLPLLPETIECLRASKNSLVSVSPNFDSLSNLTKCDLSDNKLENAGLAESFSGAHQKLQSLDLQKNQLSELPRGVVDLNALIELKLDDNPLDDKIIAASKRGISNVRSVVDIDTNKKSGGNQNKRPKRPEGIVDGIIESINTPGVNPGVVKAGYIIFGVLIFFDVILFIALGPSLHVLILFLLSIGVFGSMQWFIAALTEAQEEHDRKLMAEVDGQEPTSSEVKKDK